MVREKAEEVKAADMAGKDVVEDVTVMTRSIMAWMCLTTPVNSMTIRWSKWAMKTGITSMLGAK